MIQTEQVALHNVAELEPAEGGGSYLRRFPRAVREALSPLGRMVSQESSGCEIRFVTEARSFRISIGSLPSVLSPHERHSHDLFILRGGFVHSHHRIQPGQINHLNVVNISGDEGFAAILPQSARACGFSPQVWRVMTGRYPAVFHNLDTYGYPCRPPRPDEVPAVRWLAYGSSITQGASPSTHLNAYVYHAARIAGIDVLNQGLSGSALCEPEMAAYLCDRRDCQIISMEVGVNMRTGFTGEQFARRAEHLVERVCADHERDVVLLTIYPNSATIGHASDPTSVSAQRESDFNAALRRIAQSNRFPRLRLVEGSTILDSVGDTTVDLIHPSDYGHARMGQRLGQVLAEIVSCLSMRRAAPV